MGAGIHGGFWDTRYRVGYPVEPTEKTLDMALSPVYYAKTIADKFNIHLKGFGVPIEIDYVHDLGTGVYGRTTKDRPNVITVTHLALASEEELANTIAHELNHARSYLKGKGAPERTAYKSGNALSKYIRGKR